MRYLLLFSLVALLLGGCVQQNASAQVDAQNQSTEKRVVYCKSMNTTNEQDSCLLIVATETNVPSICQSMSRSTERDICYENLATKYQNKMYCDEISGFVQSEACKGKIDAARQ